MSRGVATIATGLGPVLALSIRPSDAVTGIAKTSPRFSQKVPQNFNSEREALGLEGTLCHSFPSFLLFRPSKSMGAGRLPRAAGLSRLDTGAHEAVSACVFSHLRAFSGPLVPGPPKPRETRLRTRKPIRSSEYHRGRLTLWLARRERRERCSMMVRNVMGIVYKQL